MDEDFLDVTEGNKKALIIFILIIAVLVIGGYFFIFKKFNFNVRTIKLELGEKLSQNVEDYLTKKVNNPSQYKLNISSVNESEVGTYTYSVTYNKKTKKGKVKVEDTKAPEFVTKEMVIEEGDTDYYLGDFLESCDDSSKPCLVTLKDDKDESKFSTVGEHTLNIVVTDLYGNKKEGEAALKVVAKGTYVDPRSQDLEVVSNSRKDENFNGLVFKKLEKGINPSHHDADDALNEVSSVDLEAYVVANYPGYKIVSSEIIELYNKSSFIVGYSIEIVISNGSERVVYAESNKVPNVTPPETSEEENE